MYFFEMETNTKTNLLTLDRQGLEDYLESLGEKRFHGRQIHAWIHRRHVTEFEQMTDLSKSLRATLQEHADIPVPRVVEVASGDGPEGATKYLFELADGNRVETVLIPSDDRMTLCVSSQVGCAFGCKFCATAMLGLSRNMTADEILGTYLAVAGGIEGRISNVVFMGMGEPLANTGEVLKTWNMLTDPDGIGLSKRKVTISTVGIPSRIRELADIPNPPKLVFSIGSPYDEVRRRLLPVAGRFSLEENRQALKQYADNTRHRITIALLIAEGMNDSPADARALHKWIGDLPTKINLLRYNEATGDFKRPSEDAVEAVAAELVRLGRTVVLRTSRGRDVAAACGQLAARQLKGTEQ
ncbi:23S rRNA (adenine(2503)-C(2))-methyltransferase RlmN [bacterium]|nr:23S rRNA (adenine(2503)-C(2))-methyltransferase RlmN [bacterium]